jgi:Mg-chelatase subunit ChlD
MMSTLLLGCAAFAFVQSSLGQAGVIQAGAPFSEPAQTPDYSSMQLFSVTPPVLVQCAPVSQAPCFSVVLTPADRDGKPVPVALPSKDRLLQSIQVQSSGLTLSPFYASTGTGSDASRRPNIVLIEVDISGSMNSPVSGGVTRFDAAKSAIAKYIESMQEGVDQIAIVPFESHNVVPTIRAAVFTGKREEAMDQLNALRSPGPKNNTALYQAVYSGVQSMQDEMETLVKPGMTEADFQPRVIVMTDGKNEVMRGDDADLLDGPYGMQQAVAKVSASGLDVVGIGFGNRGEIDADALQHLAKRVFFATTGDELVQIFRGTTPLKVANIQVTFQSAVTDRFSLGAQDSQFVFTLILPDGHRLASQPLRYLAPAIGTPLYTRQAAPEELKALILTRPAADSGWNTVIRSFLVLAICAVVLIVLWFWIPRLIWGDQFHGNLASTGLDRRWSKDMGVRASAVQMRTVEDQPGGFDAKQVLAGQQRSAGQTTQVFPRNEPAKAKINP